MKKHGHYCKVCDQYKANEKFSGKGHAAHICKSCAAMPLAERDAEIMVNRIMNLPWYLSKEKCAWLKKKCHDKRPAVRDAAQEAYDARFPFAKRNAQKKQTHVDHLTLRVDDSIYDEYGDEIPVNATFSVNRQDARISMKDDEQETSVQIPPEKMKKLLKWMVHSLEIFCWQEDYAPSVFLPSDIDDDDLLAGNFDLEEWDDEWDESDEESDVTDEPICWQLDITYRNGTSQQVISHDFLPDRVEELVQELLAYLLPEEELDDEAWDEEILDDEEE